MDRFEAILISILIILVISMWVFGGKIVEPAPILPTPTPCICPVPTPIFQPTPYMI